MTPAETPRRLGRGLGALLNAPPSLASDPGTSAGSVDAVVQRIALSEIGANPFQPRREFPATELAELASSLKATGLLQPVTVRPARWQRLADVSSPSGGSPAASPISPRYELLAGERRYRAATELGWTHIPAIVKEVDDQMALTLALVENLQRSDLNPIEEAEGYSKLLNDFSMTQQQVADVVGKDRSTVANMVRLLSLPAAVRALLRDGQLSLGHARALLALNSEHEIVAAAREAVARGLTVRDVEEISRHSAPSKRHKRATKASKRLDSHAREIEDKLRRYLQTDVRLSLTGRDRGQLSILFYSNDDLERVLELIMGRSRETL